MDNYPEEFTDLQKRPNEELQGKKWNTSFSKLYYELFITYAVYFKWVLSGGQKNQNRDFIFRLLWQVVWALQLQLYGVQEESCSGMATPDDAPCHVSSKSLCPWCICFCCSTMLRSIDAKNDNLKKKRKKWMHTVFVLFWLLSRGAQKFGIEFMINKYNLLFRKS